MIKEAINYLSDPLYSFTGFVVLFLLALKRIDIVGTKKFGMGMFVCVLLGLAPK